MSEETGTDHGDATEEQDRQLMADGGRKDEEVEQPSDPEVPDERPDEIEQPDDDGGGRDDEPGGGNP